MAEDKKDKLVSPPGKGRGRLIAIILVLGVLGAIAYTNRADLKAGNYRQVLANLKLMKPAATSESAAPAPPAPTTETKEPKILYYVDPMNPTNKSDKPGKAPCGMDMVPVYEEEPAAADSAPPPGSVRLSPQKQQLTGVQYGEVAEQHLEKTIRTVGRVTYDETRIAHVHTKFSGWIDKLYVDYTGKMVKKGQPLLTIYSPELVASQQELLIARKSMDTLTDSPVQGVGARSRSLYEATRQRLRFWDISDAQIREIERLGEPIRALTLNSTLNGFVLTRNAFAGLQVSPEMELYTIADLSSIWVIADVYEYELPMIKVGQQAWMSLSYYPGKTFKGNVSYISPDLDPATRTLKVRIELANPGFQLKPDMYANVELKVDYGRKLALPQTAVLDSGSSQMVFVAKEDGYFEPRMVKLGQRVDDKVIVLDGLKAGERVVVSANFLIDSESQLKSAVGGMTGGAHAGHAGHGGAGEPPQGMEDHSQHEAPPADHSGHGQPPAPVDHSAHGGHN